MTVCEVERPKNEEEEKNSSYLQQVKFLSDTCKTKGLFCRKLANLAFLRHQRWVKKATKRLNNQGGLVSYVSEIN